MMAWYNVVAVIMAILFAVLNHKNNKIKDLTDLYLGTICYCFMILFEILFFVIWGGIFWW